MYTDLNARNLMELTEMKGVIFERCQPASDDVTQIYAQ